MLVSFLLSFIISYILNPYVKVLQRLFLSRTASILVILSAFVVIIAFILFFVVPPLYAQTLNFINKAPDYIDYLYAKVQQLIPILANYVDIPDFDKASGDFSRQLVTLTAGAINQILQSAIAIFNSIIIIMLTPVIIFYFLNDWEKFCSFIDDLIPRRYYEIIKLQMEIINQNISGYIRGQLKVCTFLGLFYSIGLTLANVEYSLFIGITTGVLSFIPYVGTIFGLISSHLVAIYQFNDAHNVLIVTSLFIAGQLIESLLLTPKLIGSSVNIHPVWIIFSILLGGKLFGFVGILLSIPAASIVAVIMRLLVKQYKNSKYYEAKAINSD